MSPEITFKRRDLRWDSAETALNLLQSAYFDLLTIDVRLPGIDGFEVVRQLRKRHIPSRVLMLTTAVELSDKVNALRWGADDYLTKPFAIGRVFTRTELCERIWQRQHEYDTKLVEVFIGRLRKKIDEPFQVALIKTVRHLGYSIANLR